MTSYLLFSLNGARYAVDALTVLEIVWLSELTVVDEAPSYIAGVINLRGNIAPVMNLGARLGHAPQRLLVGDKVVMLQADGVTMGMIVSEVSDVAAIAAADIAPPPRYDGDAPGHDRFLAGDAKVEGEIVMLLDVPRLIHAPPLPEAAAAPRPGTRAYFCPEATDEERSIFGGRARSLTQAAERRDTAALVPLSVIQLGGECFGVELNVVREFAHLRRVTPIPCCPPRIAGSMNLRGDILTLADIRTLLNIPASSGAAEVMVVESDDMHVGITLDKVLEVIYLQPDDIASMPVASQGERNEFCKSAARYGEGMVSILDMHGILASGRLEVEEEA